MNDNLPFKANSVQHRTLAHMMRENYSDVRLAMMVNYKKSRMDFGNEVLQPLMKIDAIKAYSNNIFAITNTGVDLYMKLQDEEAVYIDAHAIPKKAVKRKVNLFGAETYDGAELRPYTGRPGANDALKLPSRMGDTLVYRKDVV